MSGDPHGQDDWDDDDAAEVEDPVQDAIDNCHGHYGHDGKFWCGAVGSEDCEFECPYNKLIGTRRSQ